MLKITKNQGSIQVTADKSGFYPFDGTITFPTNSLFTATSANTDMITFKSTSNGDVQFVGNYKDITISGRSYDTKQKFLTAFSNLANQGSVDAYTKAETDAKLDAKQGKLKAGNGITLTEDATDGTTVVNTAVSLTDNGNGAYQVGDSIEIDSKSSVRIGKNYTQSIEDMTDRVATIAIGYDAETNTTYGKGDIAIGDKAQSFSTGAGSIAIGKDTLAYGDRGYSSIVIGSGAKVKRDDSAGIIIGSDAYVTFGFDSIVIGNGAYSYTGNRSVVIGDGTYTFSGNNVNIGSRRGMTGECNVAVGTGGEYPENQFNGKYSIAIGHSSSIGNNDGADLHQHDIAIGYKANATGIGAVAIGRTAKANNDKPLVINAGYKTVDNNTQPLTVLQSDANGKLSILKGDGTDERIVIQDALSAGGSGGTVDAYTKTETDTKLEAKQDKLTAGNGITIDENNVISSTGGSGGSANPLVNVKGTNGDATIAEGVTDAVAIGSGASVTKKNSVAIGNGATSGSGGSNIAIGILANSSGGTSIAIGKNAVTSNINATAIGTNASAGIPKSIAIGYGAKTSTNIPMVINAGGKTMFQGDSNGKISIPLGDGTASTMCLQDEIAALKAEIAALKGGASTGA